MPEHELLAFLDVAGRTAGPVAIAVLDITACL
jgi:hypothetical protein